MARNSGRTAAVNNDIYFALGEHWYADEDSPVALLRAESKLRNPWIGARLAESFGDRPCRVLDVGCGAGFLSNDVALRGRDVTGIDVAADALAVARAHDASGRVRYVEGDALALPFEDGSFDAVCAMDLLEHLQSPERAIAEASRVLVPRGLFFFHTFNRNFLSWLVIIEGVEKFVRNAPEHLHVLHLFLKPEQVRAACTKYGLDEPELVGVRPKLTPAFWRMLVTGRVSRNFTFTFTRSTRLAYTGVARKRDLAPSIAPSCRSPGP
jgi:2-polyprenyl-6-hydroxyphenyl methylase/3-demethylubiquinone-9 3-methyltransferase